MIERIILGTAQLGIPGYGVNNESSGFSPDSAISLLSYARSRGIRTIDIADKYGDINSKVTKYNQSQNQQDRFDILTKFQTIPSDFSEYVDVLCDTLQTDEINCISFHHINDFIESYDNLTAFKDPRVKNLGVSIYTNEEFSKAIESSEINIIQIPFNALDNIHQRGELIVRAKQYNKIIHTRSTFLQGLFYKTKESLPKKLKPLHKYLSLLNEIRNDYKLETHEIAILYPLLNNNIDGVIIGVDSREQLDSNLQALEKSAPKSLISDLNNIKVQEIELLIPTNWSN